MQNKTKPIETIFYSWQSDSPKDTNCNAIRKSLRDVSSLLEDEIDDLRIVVDEATREMSGSPNIPKAIFDKISKCDVFICDLTTINSKSPTEFRRTPNPNVLIELGYAIATVGWERIIMLFNEEHGEFPNDLPFDIDRHRSTKFKIKDAKDKIGKSELSQVLKYAIEITLLSCPPRPNEILNLTPDEIKRNSDIKHLRTLMV